MKLFTKALAIFTTVAVLLSIAASGPQTVENNAAPFAILSERQIQMANVSLLTRLMGLPLTSAGVANILSNAAPFQTFSDRNLSVINTYLLYQLTGAATNVPISDAAFTNIWLYGDIASGIDGSTVLSVLNGRALYDEKGNDAIDFYLDNLLGNPSSGYALNNQDGSIALAWDLHVLAGSWFNNAQLVVTNGAAGIRLSYLGCGFTNVLVQFTNTGAAGDFVQIANSNLTAGGVVGAYQLVSTNAVSTFNANKAALISSNVVTSPYLWTNTLGYNVFVYVSQGTNNGIAQNGTGIGFFTNTCTTLFCQPNDYVWVTNNGGRPNFLIKPF